jgi:hypothetical protein
LDRPPNFEAGPHADPVADFQNGPIAVAEKAEICHAGIRHAGCRRSHTGCTELHRPVHVPLHFLDTGSTSILVVHPPLEKGDNPFNKQPMIVNSLSQLREVASPINELPNSVLPRFNPLVSSLGGDVNLLFDGEIETE